MSVPGALADRLQKLCQGQCHLGRLLLTGVPRIQGQSGGKNSLTPISLLQFSAQSAPLEQPSGWPATQGGSWNPGDPLHLPSEPPSLSSCLSPGPAAYFFWGTTHTGPHSSIPWTQSKARPPPAASLGPALQPTSLLSHLHTAPCTQHHVSKQLTLPRELGGRERGGGKGSMSGKSSLGSTAEALPIPATRGLQAPQQGLYAGPGVPFFPRSDS